MKEIILGEQARIYFELLKTVNWKSNAIDTTTKGGIFQITKNHYIAFDNTDGTNTVIETFDNILEAAIFVTTEETKIVHITII